MAGSRRRRRYNPAEDVEKIIELLKKAKARGDLDDPEIAERVLELKNLATQLPGVKEDVMHGLRLFKATKAELYEFGATIIAKIVKEFST